MTTVAQKFAHTLREIGVRYVFGVPSGNMTDYIEALRIEKGIDFILTGHESAAAFMAGVCGRLTGVPGACFATFGPGATNLATGVGGALLDRFPLIAFTDEMPGHLLKRKVQMNIDHQQLFFPLTKWTSRASKDNMEEMILKAAGIATDGVPGPVHIGVPAGIGQKQVSSAPAEVDYLRLEKKRWAPLVPEQLQKAKRIFEKSNRPLFVVGRAAVQAGVKKQLQELSEKFRIPVVLTPMAKGMFPEDHELYTGVLFHALSDIVAKTYNEADLIIGIGYDPVEFNYEEWMPPVPLIHIDSEEADIDKNQYPNTYNVVGNIENALAELSEFLSAENIWNHRSIRKRKEEMFARLAPVNTVFSPRSVVKTLRSKLPPEGILTVDVGAHLHLIGQQWKTPEPEKLLITNGWSSMGFAIPAALAAKLCRPELPVAALMGDGGFAMMAGELATAKRLNLKIVFVVIYDDSLSLISIKQRKKGFSAGYGTRLGILTEKPANHCFGVPVLRAANMQEFSAALDKAFTSAGPAVVEAVSDGNEYKDLLLKPNKQ